MELLIPGLIIVALMVYASTRIKRTAAAAFDEETIETDDFVIKKPSGFLHNLNGDPKYVFEAYSKGFSEDNPKLRTGTATVKIVKDSTLDGVAKTLTSAGAALQSSEVVDGRHYRTFEEKKKDGDAEIFICRKIGESGSSVMQLDVTAVDEDASPWVETFIDSFRVK